MGGRKPRSQRVLLIDLSAGSRTGSQLVAMCTPAAATTISVRIGVAVDDPLHRCWAAVGYCQVRVERVTGPISRGTPARSGRGILADEIGRRLSSDQCWALRPVSRAGSFQSLRSWAALGESRRTASPDRQRLAVSLNRGNLFGKSDSGYPSPGRGLSISDRPGPESRRI
jgi:hypothetical protein